MNTNEKSNEDYITISKDSISPKIFHEIMCKQNDKFKYNKECSICNSLKKKCENLGFSNLVFIDELILKGIHNTCGREVTIKAPTYECPYCTQISSSDVYKELELNGYKIISRFSDGSFKVIHAECGMTQKVTPPDYACKICAAKNSDRLKKETKILNMLELNGFKVINYTSDFNKIKALHLKCKKTVLLESPRYCCPNCTVKYWRRISYKVANQVKPRNKNENKDIISDKNELIHIEMLSSADKEKLKRNFKRTLEKNGFSNISIIDVTSGNKQAIATHLKCGIRSEIYSTKCPVCTKIDKILATKCVKVNYKSFNENSITCVCNKCINKVRMDVDTRCCPVCVRMDYIEKLKSADIYVYNEFLKKENTIKYKFNKCQHIVEVPVPKTFAKVSDIQRECLECKAIERNLILEDNGFTALNKYDVLNKKLKAVHNICNKITTINYKTKICPICRKIDSLNRKGFEVLSIDETLKDIKVSCVKCGAVSRLSTRDVCENCYDLKHNTKNK